MDTLTLFSKNLNQRSLTPRWPLTPCLLRSHVWLYPRIIVSKSHYNSSMYVDTVISSAKYHIHTYILHTYYRHTMYISTYRMSDHIVSYWTQFRRDNKNWYVHSKTPIVVTVLWLDSDDVVTILSSTRNLVEGYKIVYLCHLDSYTVTVCNGYLVSFHAVTVSCLLGA